ncbi:hypothetical protein CPSG_09416 [Coccidioides posadasii str. Silveira]|uniref:Uncharacterized protein n=1 Tax=Coccidioides posadasii (strain RMSCC 757 / Silveira) TaxID=443226 RepID=E9DHW7_COCPS|nr:hypothetical protein CPSG_09416 [Coccidioides posadasii str. Silveira]
MNDASYCSQSNTLELPASLVRLRCSWAQEKVAIRMFNEFKVDFGVIEGSKSARSGAATRLGSTQEGALGLKSTIRPMRPVDRHYVLIPLWEECLLLGFNLPKAGMNPQPLPSSPEIKP